MRIDELIRAQDGPLFSFELYPPRSDAGERTLRDTLAQLRELGPAFASVTCGAGGSTRGRTLELTKSLKRELGIEAMAHLTCVGTSAEELRRTLDELAQAGIENVLALRGDPPAGVSDWQGHPQGLEHAEQLVELVTEEFGLCCGAACFPESHPQAPDPLTELQFLKAKVQAGASFLITQLFFDNDHYLRFVEAARFAGITVPILPGIMPITSTRQIKTITALCGASLAPGLLEALELRADDAESVTQLGVAYATLQCAQLLERGAPGIHFYTLNRSPATRAILSALRLAPSQRSAPRRQPDDRPLAAAGSTSRLSATVSSVRPARSRSQALASDRA